MGHMLQQQSLRSLLPQHRLPKAKLELFHMVPVQLPRLIEGEETENSRNEVIATVDVILLEAFVKLQKIGRRGERKHEAYVGGGKQTSS